jgi:hypothetical protein
MAVSNTIMILQQQYNQHNPIKTRLIVIAVKECEEHHGENVQSRQSRLLAGRGNGNNW